MLLCPTRLHNGQWWCHTLHRMWGVWSHHCCFIAMYCEVNGLSQNDALPIEGTSTRLCYQCCTVSTSSHQCPLPNIRGVLCSKAPQLQRQWEVAQVSRKGARAKDQQVFAGSNWCDIGLLPPPPPSAGSGVAAVTSMSVVASSSKRCSISFPNMDHSGNGCSFDGEQAESILLWCKPLS